LQSEIGTAIALLNDYSNVATNKYSKVTDADRTALQQAIAQAAGWPANATEEDIAEARTALANAVAVFRNAISAISMVPGIFDFALYSSKGGSVVVNANDMGSWRNNGYVVYKFRARKRA
jgi:hypothetical protein